MNNIPSNNFTEIINNNFLSAPAVETSAPDNSASIFEQEKIEFEQKEDAQALLKQLDSFGKAEEFKEKATKNIEAGKETTWNKEAYESEDNFVNYYTKEIFGDNEEMNLEDFGEKLIQNGLLDEKTKDGFLALIDKNGDETLSKYELQVLLSAAYAGYQEIKNEETKKDDTPNAEEPTHPSVQEHPSTTSINIEKKETVQIGETTTSYDKLSEIASKAKTIDLDELSISEFMYAGDSNTVKYAEGYGYFTDSLNTDVIDELAIEKFRKETGYKGPMDEKTLNIARGAYFSTRGY